MFYSVLFSWGWSLPCLVVYQVRVSMFPPGGWLQSLLKLLKDCGVWGPCQWQCWLKLLHSQQAELLLLMMCPAECSPCSVSLNETLITEFVASQCVRLSLKRNKQSQYINNNFRGDCSQMVIPEWYKCGFSFIQLCITHKSCFFPP